MAVEIIAEMAQGYEGNEIKALLLARGAIRSGADTIKYQLVHADELATPDYQYYDLFQSLEMSSTAWKDVAEEIKTNGKKLYFDVFGMQGLSEALELGADGVKIHTTDFYNNDVRISQFTDIYYFLIDGICNMRYNLNSCS